MKVLKIFNRFFPKNGASNLPSSMNSELLGQIQSHIDFLRFVSPKPEEQLARRLSAMKALAAIGLDATIAIPALIKIHFNGITIKEREQALEAINNIDTNWLIGDYNNEILTFLLQQLKKESLKAKKAENFLVQMAAPAIVPLKNLIQLDSTLDQFAKSNALRTLSKIKPQTEDLLMIIQEVVHSASSNLELETCAEALGMLENWDDSTIALLTSLSTDRDTTIKQKALASLAKAKGGNLDIAIGVEIGHLMEEDAALRQLAVKALSANKESNKLKEILTMIIEKNGKPELGDFRKIFENLFFWIQDKKLEPFRVDPIQGLNNVSWQRFELEKAMQRPKILLESALAICNNISFFDPQLYNKITSVFESQEITKIKVECIKILGQIKERTNDTIPFLLNHLQEDSTLLRENILKALNNLDEKWFLRPESSAWIINLIKGINGYSSKENAIELFKTLGPGTVPQLVKELETINNRFAQEAIVVVLQSHDSSEEVKANFDYLTQIQAKMTNMHIVSELEKLLKQIKLQ